MPKFRKKPVVIDAVQIPQWFNTNAKSLTDFQTELGAEIIRVPINRTRQDYIDSAKNGTLFIWIGGPQYKHPHEDAWYEVLSATILSPEGVHDIFPMNWIITGVEGERYFILDEIFKKTYESVE